MIPFLVSLFASIVGAICGIGGGVIIKPILDMLGIASVSTISFLSSCTVLSMSCYSVSRSILSGEKAVDTKIGTPLAIGAAIGGVAGKQMFTVVKELFQNPDMVGAVQSACLALITLATLIYTLCKAHITTMKLASPALCVVVGLLLGILSSFLGIGGGPINLMVLSFLFSMDSKAAAANSLYIILFSQVASLFITLVTSSVPEFDLMTLVLMSAGGICGGILGRILNKKMDNQAVDKLFILLMFLIVIISASNIFRYIG